MPTAGRGLGLAETKCRHDAARGPIGRFKSWAAEFERELLRERVKSGMAQARRSGKHVGRLARSKFHSGDIEKMKLLRSQGVSMRKLATDFGTSQWMAARLTAYEAAHGA
jgi:DNA invertase Pin-like site-specific DNA recombinase